MSTKQASSKNKEKSSVVAEPPVKEARTRKKNGAKGNGATSHQLDSSEIAARAWQIWQEKGCPEGCDLENWLQAEKELQSH